VLLEAAGMTSLKPPQQKSPQAQKPHQAQKTLGLGRGLSALLGEAVSLGDRAQNIAPQDAPQRQLLPLGLLKPNTRQPRRHFDEEALNDLEASIRERGILQPILVRPHPEQLGSYEIVAGERRWRAAGRAGLAQAPVVIMDLTDGEVLELALVENIQRQDLNPIEEAQGYKRLLEDFGHSQDALAKLVGKSRSHVTNLLRLLELPLAVQNHVLTGALSMGHARALVGAPEAEGLADYIVQKSLSVRAVENLLRARKEPRQNARSARAVEAHASLTKPLELSEIALDAKDPDLLYLEEELSARMGTPVRVLMQHDKSGVVSVDFSSLEELDALCKRLAPGFGNF
jgi:ParB family transcriptional regulator, chromosome partitioning protein